MNATSDPTVLIVIDSAFSARDLMLRGPSLRDAAVATLTLPEVDRLDLVVDEARTPAPEIVLSGLFMRASYGAGGPRNPYVAPKRRPPKSIGGPRR